MTKLDLVPYRSGPSCGCYWEGEYYICALCYEIQTSVEPEPPAMTESEWVTFQNKVQFNDIALGLSKDP